MKLGYTVPVKGIVPMCAPMYIKSEKVMYEGVLEYAREYKNREGKSQEQIELEMAHFQKRPMETLRALQGLISDVREHVNQIDVPLFVAQARHDHMINTDSANIIYNSVNTEQKSLKWYEESGHVITLDKERDQLHQDVFAFLESLDWAN